MNEVKTILCIDDELEVIELITLILSRENYNVFGAVGGKDGLAKIKELKPDLVLLDLLMSDMDGWELYNQMKTFEATRDIPVIALRARSRDIDRALGLHLARVDEYVSKPFAPDVLTESISRVLNGKSATG